GEARRRLGTGVVGAAVAIVAARRRPVDALAGGRVAAERAVAGRRVLADHRRMGAAGDRIAGVGGAAVAVVALQRSDGRADAVAPPQPIAAGAAPVAAAILIGDARVAFSHRPGRAVLGRPAAGRASRAGLAVVCALVAQLPEVHDAVATHLEL